MKIALIGAGPRNLMALERLVCWGISTNYSANVEISLFDPFGIGGRVWNPDQNHELKMNSLAEKSLYSRINLLKWLARFMKVRVYLTGP